MTDVEKLIERLEQGIDSVFDPDKGIPEAEAVMDKAAAILRALAAEKYNYLEYENALAKKRDEIASLRAKLDGPPPLEQEVWHLDGQIKTLLKENEALRAEKATMERELGILETSRDAWRDENKALRAKLEGLREAAQALLDDVHRRYPGEALRCPYMIALEAEAADART